MKSINWKIGIFWVTCVLSVLFGYLVVKKSALYSDIVRSISYQRMDVMLLPATLNLCQYNYTIL